MKKRRTTLPLVQADGERLSYHLRSQADLIDRMVRLGYTTGYQLAQAAGLGAGTVNHLVFGRRTSCSAETAIAIESALNVPPGEIFTRREYRVSPYPKSPTTPPRKRAA